MKTETGKLYAETFDPSALKQIRDWSKRAEQTLKILADEQWERRDLKAAKKYLEDMDTYRTFASMLQTMINAANAGE